MSVSTIFLIPFAALYKNITGIRNRLYDLGYKKSYRFDIPIVSVGNLNIGGTGKTPTIEYLIRLLKSRYKLVTLSRGYGRKTKGLRFAGEQDNALTLGDEPYQLYRNYGTTVGVVVGEDRVHAIRKVLQQNPDVSALLLDDAYQHRAVKPHLSILTTDFEHPFYDDFILPVGRLRESRKGAARAHCIVVTKCPERVGDTERNAIRERIVAYAGNKPIFFSHILYGTPQPFWDTSHKIEKQVVLLSGIARSDPFERYAHTQFKVLKHFRYRDHHLYRIGDIERIKQYIEKQKNPVTLLTTEKDRGRLLDPVLYTSLSALSCYYLPIEMGFSGLQAEFDNMVINTLEKVGKQ